MDSKERRLREKAAITDGSDELVVNGKLFFKHPVHYANYEFTVSQRDKFWGLRVMLALNHAVWALLHHQRPSLSRDCVTSDGEAWRKESECFACWLVVPSKQSPMLFGITQNYAYVLCEGSQDNRLRMAADFAWHIGLEAIKTSPVTDWSLFQASAARCLHQWLIGLTSDS